MDNGNTFCFFAFLILAVTFAYRSDATACQAQRSQVVNETHPSASNNWQASDDLHTPYIEDERSDVKKNTSLSPKLPMTDTEQWNSTTLTAFCPDISRLFIDCADEKGEAIGAFKNSSIYTAYCTVVLGLSCKPGKNFQTNHCPDFAVTYGCKCPTTTTSTTTATITTRIKRSTTTPRRKKTTNPPRTSSVSQTSMTGLHSSTTYNSRTSTQPTTERTYSTESKTSSATESKSSNDSREDGGLSTGVIAGIAAGSLLLLILIIVLVIRLWLYLKNKQNNKVAELPKAQQI